MAVEHVLNVEVADEDFEVSVAIEVNKGRRIRRVSGEAGARVLRERAGSVVDHEPICGLFDG